VVKGYTQFPLEGVSFEATLNDAAATTDKQTQFYSMGGTRAIWHQGWKAAAISPSAPDAWAGYATQRWELFNTDEDPSECHDLAGKEPEKLQELIQLWWAHAGQYNALPLENRNAIEILTTDRPQLTKPRNRYVYYPGTASVPEWQSAIVRGRSFQPHTSKMKLQPNSSTRSPPSNLYSPIDTCNPHCHKRSSIRVHF